MLPNWNIPHTENDVDSTVYLDACRRARLLHSGKVILEFSVMGKWNQVEQTTETKSNWIKQLDDHREPLALILNTLREF